jgi:hypothetical protein
MRLVDADALIEVIKESRPLNWTDSDSELQEDADYNHFIEMVNAQPTAYDIEKVVAELEYEAKLQEYLRQNASARGNEAQAHIHRYAEQCYRNKATEIVRKGGAT